MEIKMELNKIHHIAIIGSDYQKSKHFYVDLLGFKIIRENYRNERDDYKIDLKCGDLEIELFIIKNAPKRPSYPEALGLRHLAFYVEDVEAMVTQLNKKGIKTEPIRIDDYTNKKMTFFFDPDGLPLEIHE
jgi:glyoxylase I family protein